MPGQKDDGALFKGLVAIALILAGIIFFYLGRRMWPESGGRAVPVSNDVSTSTDSAGKSERAPARIPPMKLIRIEKRRQPKASLPSQPMPPITPDRR